jgi:hypothetical protein
MPTFERLDFPKKYPQPGWVKLIVLALIVAGIAIHNCSQTLLAEEIEISDVKITEFSRLHIEVQYIISNKSNLDRDLWLLLTAFDTAGKELGSTLFQVRAKAGKTQPMLKIMDKLTRPMNKDEKPDKATIVLYKRKVI